MERRSGDAFGAHGQRTVYVDRGLNTGVFKLITTLGEFLPSYNRDAAAGEELRLIYRASGDEPDEPFTVSKEATYIVKVDLLDLTMTMTETENIGWRFEEFYIVGSFTGDNGWGFEALSKDAVQMNLFHYGAVIPWKADGDFKFTSVTDFGQSDAFFHPTEGTLRILPLQLYWEVKTINGK